LTITFDPKDLLRYYDVLEVAPGVSWDELRTAYRKRVSEYHPDRVSRLGRDLRAVAEEKMKQINEAYSVLAQELRNES
jgi:DnaJ like chaperone protein